MKLGRCRRKGGECTCNRFCVDAQADTPTLIDGLLIAAGVYAFAVYIVIKFGSA